MFCKSCGKELADNTLVCPFCKTVTKKGETMPPPPTQVIIPEANAEARRGLSPVILASLIAALAIVVLVTVGILTNGFGLFKKDGDSAKSETDSTEQSSEATSDVSETDEPGTEEPETDEPETDEPVTDEPSYPNGIYVVPVMSEKSIFEDKILGKVTDEKSLYILNAYYILIDLNDPSLTKERREYIKSEYQLAEKMPIYVLDSMAAKREKETLAIMIHEQTSYRMEDMLADYKTIGYEYHGPVCEKCGETITEMGDKFGYSCAKCFEPCLSCGEYIHEDRVETDNGYCEDCVNII